MGIPVPVKRADKGPLPLGKYPGRVSRAHKRDDSPLDFPENDMLQGNNNVNPIAAVNQKEDFKRGSEVSRMGNYFNIVIAPPPIKALQPRKLIGGDAYRTAAKRIT
ncbi:unnamed protein product [Arctia plantaginis]|nr:unnamed protein product [Arctia plantaginis]